MDSTMKQLMAVFSLMLGLSLGIPYAVSEADERNAGWLMLAILFLLIALGFYLWIMREQRTAEDAAKDALDAAEENLKKLEAQATDATEADDTTASTPFAEPESVEDERIETDVTAATDVALDLSSDADDSDIADDMFDVTGDPAPPAEPAISTETDADDSDAEVSGTVIEVEDVEDIEELAEDTQAGDPVAETAIADESAAPDADVEPDDFEVKAGTGDNIDLTVIEGIGPKYQKILNKAGITTFAQLAAMSADEIVNLVKANGGRKAASMVSWADQAKLADAGDWEALDKLQDELTGGRRD
ncbi:MAG: hypothetical protein AAF846_20960 [Chloroflexota bacterium]